MGGRACCTITCTPLIEAQEKLAHGITFSSPPQQQVYHLASAMFVVDNTTYTNNFHRWIHHETNPKDIIESLHHDSQIWERLLWTSVGFLGKLTKCLYYVIHWEFDSEGKASLMPSTNLEPHISLSSDNTGSHNTITQLDCTTSHRTLGTWLNPSLGMQEARMQLQNSINVYSKR
jgi:hypothetical protein